MPRHKKHLKPVYDLRQLPVTLTVDEAGVLLRCCRQTVINRIRAGQLPGVKPDGCKCYIIPRDALAAALGLQEVGQSAYSS